MSYRTNLTERLVTIVFLLVRGAHSRQELAQQFEVSVKTISKDIAALTRQYPIAQTRRGREVFYRFADGYEYKVPRLDAEEVATLLLAQTAIANIGITATGSPYGKFADSLLEKIRRALPPAVRDRMEALANVYGSAAIPAKNFAAHTEIIDRLATAAVQQKRAEILYHSLNHDEELRRTVEPYAVYYDPDGTTLKLIGKDLRHSEVRVFSIERVRAVAITEHKFVRPPNFDLQQYLSDNCFNGIHGAPVTVRLRAWGMNARIFAERRFHPSQKLIGKTKAGKHHTRESTTIELTVAAGRGLERFILSWLPNIEVLSPPQVREKINQILRQSLDDKATTSTEQIENHAREDHEK